MAYKNLLTNEYFDIQQLRGLHRNVSFPSTGPDTEWLAENSYEYVDSIPVDIDTLRTNLINTISSYRYELETGGVTIDGVFVATDDRSKTLLFGASIKAKEAILNQVGYSIDWKTSNGWVTLSAEQVVTISDTVWTFIQQCFQSELGHVSIINGLSEPSEITNYTITDDWPSNIISLV